MIFGISVRLFNFITMRAKITKKLGCVILTAFSISFLLQNVQAQEQELYDYNQEFIWGINKNTNSGLVGGLAGKFGRRIKGEHFQTFGLEIVNVKHPKELRQVSQLSGNTYILGKSNYLFSIRPQYGQEWTLFKKAPQQGVQINAILAGGPTIGIVKPYYVQVSRGGGRPGDNNPAVVPYNPNPPYSHNRANIIGAGPFLKGIGESEINIGANIKAALSFEFGTFKNDVTGFEAGFQLEAFSKKVELVPSAATRSIYPSAFIMLFYGYRR